MFASTLPATLALIEAFVTDTSNVAPDAGCTLIAAF